MRYILLCLGGFAVQVCFIFSQKTKKHSLSALLKCLASLCFVALGFLTLLSSSGGIFPVLIFSGLLISMIGDTLLGLRYVFAKSRIMLFLFGMVFILGAHALYLTAIAPLSSHHIVYIVAGILASAFALAMIFSHIDKVRFVFKIYAVLYITIAILMSVFSLGCLFENPMSSLALFLSLSTVFLAASDLILIFITFTKKNLSSARITGLTAYYIGQLLIACCVLFS